MCTENQIAVRLRDLICLRYEDWEEGFRDLLLVSNDKLNYDNEVKGNNTFSERAMKVVKWYRGFYGSLPGPAKLAKLVQGTCDRPDFNQLVLDIETHLATAAAPAPPPASGGAPPAVGPPPGTLPAGVAGALAQFAKQPSLEQLVETLRPTVRAKEYKQSGLPGQFHASAAAEQRLVSVLVLEAHPDPVYLRWQADAVAVGPPFLGTMAAQSLIGAALRLPTAELPWIDLAVQRALQVLNALPSGHPAANARPDIDMAAALSDMRKGQRTGLMGPDDLNQFLEHVTQKFDLDGLMALCRRASQAELNYFVRVAGPPEYIAAALLDFAREKRWELKLLEAAHLQRPDDQGLALIHKRYPLAA